MKGVGRSASSSVVSSGSTARVTPETQAGTAQKY